MKDYMAIELTISDSILTFLKTYKSDKLSNKIVETELQSRLLKVKFIVKFQDLQLLVLFF